MAQPSAPQFSSSQAVRRMSCWPSPSGARPIRMRTGKRRSAAAIMSRGLPGTGDVPYSFDPTKIAPRAGPVYPPWPHGSVHGVASFTAGWRGAIRKANIGTAINDNRIGDQARNARELKEGIASAGESGSDLAGKTQATAAQAASTIRDTAIETGKQASDAAAKTYQQASQAADYVRRNAAEQPLMGSWSPLRSGMQLPT